jgi:hypothetical protein
MALPAPAEPDRHSYQVSFGETPPASGDDALKTSFGRADTVIKYMACGGEAAFSDGSSLRNRPDDHPIYADAEEIGESMIHRVMAKMIVYTRWDQFSTGPAANRSVCAQHVEYFTLEPKKNPGDPDVPHPVDLSKLGQQMVELFGRVCSGAVQNPTQGPDGLVKVDYALTRDCIRSEINTYLRQAYVDGHPGSSGLPCFPLPIKVSNGEWDVDLKEFTRVYFLNQRAGQEDPPLDPDVRDHVRNDLLTLDGAPGEESYNLGECGNSEYSTGPPDSRVDDQSWTKNALHDVGDALGWLAKWLIRLLALLLAAAIAFAVLAALVGPLLAGAIVSGLVALGAVAITFGTFPESENHRLMIETSRFLNNQIILDESDPANSNRGNMNDDQNEVRDWLLKRLQRIAKEDFVEYNARPYQRYSIGAIRNLADFAKDDHVRMAARNILDLASAKFAVASSAGRRLVPFRRLMEVIQTHVDSDGHNDKGELQYNGVMDMEAGADHQIAAMLIYLGQTQQAPGAKITTSAVDEMTSVAASDYRPPPAVLDFAIDKRLSTGPISVAEKPSLQAFKNGGAEIYSSTSGYLLTAGGIQAPPSSTIEIAGISPGGSILGIIPLSNNKDRGAAVPTTLMLSAGADRSSMEAFLRIAGSHHTLDSSNATYDDNLCVYRGFACGLNMTTPADMESCFTPGPPGTPDQWRFFDSAICAPYNGAARVMIARYQQSCQDDQTGQCNSNLGLFEVVSNSIFDFPTFQKTVLANNPGTAGWLGIIGGLFGSNRVVLSGTYTNLFGEKIEFDTDAHRKDSNRTGIVSINGATTAKLENWATAAGDLINPDGGAGRYKFINPRTGHGFTVDMSNSAAPSRTDF